MNINAFEFSGTIENVVPTQMKNGSQLARAKINQSREYQGRVTTDTIEVTAFGSVAQNLLAMKPGTRVLIAGKLTGRWTEFNGRQFLSESRLANAVGVMPAESAAPADAPGDALEEDVKF